MSKKFPHMYRLLDSKHLKNFIAIFLILTSFVGAFFLISSMYWEISDNNGSWSYELSAVYYGVVRLLTAVILMMNFFAYVLARKHILKTPFNIFTSWLFIVGGKMVFLSSLSFPLWVNINSVGRERLKYASMYNLIFAGNGMVLCVIVVSTLLFLIIEYPIHTFLRWLLIKCVSNDEIIESYHTKLIY